MYLLITIHEFPSNRGHCLQATTPDWHNSNAFMIFSPTSTFFFTNIYPLLHEVANNIYFWKVWFGYIFVNWLIKEQNLWIMVLLLNDRTKDNVPRIFCINYYTTEGSVPTSVLWLGNILSWSWFCDEKS